MAPSSLYLACHVARSLKCLPNLLQELFSSILFQQPADPLDFIVAECKRLKSVEGGRGVSRLWSDEDLRAMHSLYDPSGRGVITKAQVMTALRNLGVRTANVPPPAEDVISVDTFVRIARAAIDAER